MGKIGDPDFNFNEAYEQFCEEAGIDEIPDINTDQRMIIVGSEVRDKLGSVALWLREHSINIKIIEVELFREGDTLFIQPQTIIPFPVSRFLDIGTGSIGDGTKPWLTDGRAWHLDKKCSPDTRSMLLELDDLIRDNIDVEGPYWKQKYYISYRIDNYNWLTIQTRPSVLTIHIYVKKGTIQQSDIAKQLHIQEFDRDEPLAEKLGLPSSILIRGRNESTDRIIIRMKEDFDLKRNRLVDFLISAFEFNPKS